MGNAPNQPFKFRAKNCVEINDDRKSANSQIEFKPIMLKSSFCDYSDAYILAKEAIKITGVKVASDPTPRQATRKGNQRNKGVILKSFQPFTECIQVKYSR